LGDEIKNEMGEYVACTGKSRGTYKVLVGKPEGKRPLDRLKIILK